LQIASVLYAVRYSAFVGEDFDVSEVVELGRRISLSRLSVSLWVKGLCFGAVFRGSVEDSNQSGQHDVDCRSRKIRR
jgi:hypothetical protein